jgi:Flp pilus assembly protein TadG
MFRFLRRFLRDDRGAVAPVVALSLVGLIAVGGIAFDYAHLVALDTELKQAADQAALAAVTQLDRSDDAIDHAEAAIQDATTSNRLAANLTRFANDGSGTGVEIDSITFCSAFDDDEADTSDACTVTTDPVEARFVWVKTSLRTANYAFTPIAGAFAGTSHAEAVAGIESSICNISPLFVCAPSENFPSDADIGKGLLLKTGAANAWFPGNYGFLDLGPGNPGVIDALLGHGLNGCQKIDETNTEPGNKNATDAINTRFDVYAGTGATNSPSICTDTADGTGCPDQDTGKDMAMTMTYVLKQNSGLAQPVPPVCGTPATAKTGNPNPSLSYSAFVQDSSTKGMPRDGCHYTSCADGNFGDGVWNYSAYMAANHPTIALSAVPNTGPGNTPTRYDVYKWEIEHRGDTPGALDPIDGVPVLTDKKTQGTNTTYTFTKKCAFRKPVAAKGPADQGRRILPVIAANCESLNGKSNLDEFHAIRVFNVFLTEPSLQRTAAATGVTGATAGTDDKEIYGEVVGPADTPAGGSGFQYYSRNRPYLVR